MAQAPLYVLCDICETKEEVYFYCVDCQEVLCARCKLVHVKGKKTQTDEIILLSQARQGIIPKSSVIFCDNHPTVKVTLYCQKCDTLICTECLDVKHQDHRIISF